MKIIYTETAISDLDAILQYQKEYWPQVRIQFVARLNQIERAIVQHPLMGREVAERPGIRVVSFITYPFRLFYVVREDAIDVLHIHHTSRKPWYE